MSPESNPPSPATSEEVPTSSPSRAAASPATSHGHRPAAAAQVPATLVPEAGWHVLHVFYRVDRKVLAELPAAAQQEGREVLGRVLDRSSPGAPEQIQCFAVPGHKADFGVMLAGADLKAAHGIQMAIQGSPLGPALIPTYSFYSITEVSEYVPGV